MYSVDVEVLVSKTVIEKIKKNVSCWRAVTNNNIKNNLILQKYQDAETPYSAQ